MKYVLATFAMLMLVTSANAWVGSNGKHHPGPAPDCHATLRGC